MAPTPFQLNKQTPKSSISPDSTGGSTTPTSAVSSQTQSSLGYVPLESGGRMERFKHALSYDPFSQETSIARYKEWRDREKRERQVKRRQRMVRIQDRARGLVGLDPANRDDLERELQEMKRMGPKF